MEQELRQKEETARKPGSICSGRWGDFQFAWPLPSVPTHSCARSDKALRVDLSAGFKK